MKLRRFVNRATKAIALTTTVFSGSAAGSRRDHSWGRKLRPSACKAKTLATSTLVSCAAGAVASLLLTGLAFAQADWTLKSPAHVPPKRMYTVMAQFGSSGSAVVMFGGLNLGPPGVFSQFNVLDDTWTWNGTDWTQLSPSLSPPARYAASMAFDPVSGKAVLFGGRSAAGQLLSDTWLFAPHTSCSGKVCVTSLRWSQVTPATSPPARAEAAMAFDDAGALQKVILTGGTNGSGTLNDTWRFDTSTNTWTLETGFPGGAGIYAPARQDTAVASCHPSLLTGALLFGGFNGSFVSPLADTWIHEVATVSGVSDAGWFLFLQNSQPTGRLGHAMADYPVSNRAVLYGGQAWSQLFNRPALLTDTWNGSCNTSTGQWVDAAPAHNPGAKVFHAMTTGPSGLTVVLFGGSSVGFPRLASGPAPNGQDQNQTWTWGRQVACVPTDGSEVVVGTEVTCLFDATEGVTFSGWTTEGFAPPHSDNSFIIFHTEAPGESSITAQWTDSSGSHSETFDYTIVRRPHP
jgi:hypothetical protein